MTSQPRSLIFLHIRKTAGTTLVNILNKAFKPDSIYSVQHEWPVEYFLQMPDDEKARIRLFRGHVPFGQHANLAAPCRYFTLLRDPLDRVVSYYYFLLKTPTDPWYDYTIRNRISLEQYVDDPYFTEVDNMQTRFLAGLDVDFPYGQVTESHLVLAKQHVADWFDVAGLSEQFDETLLLLQRMYGWQWIYYAPLKVNRKRPPKSAIDPALLQRIALKNTLDIELYAWVKARFEQQVAAAGPQFQKDLARFRRQNRYIALLLRVYWTTLKVVDFNVIRDLWHQLNHSR